MTKYLSTSEIERRAARLLEEVGNASLPVDVEEIASHLGVRIEFAELGDDVSGVLVRAKNAGTIGVNAKHPRTRQRFTIAHEIGHFVLHSSSDDVFIDKSYTAVFRDHRSSSGRNRQEIQANQFAAALLMPKHLVSKRIRELKMDLGDEESLFTLSEEVGVSAQALTYRLANIDFFDNEDMDSNKTP